MDRRQLIKCTVLGSGATLLSSCKTIAQLPRYPVQTSGEIAVPLTDFTADQLLLAHPQSGLPISLLRQSDGQYSACLMSCTHMKCETLLKEDYYVCPCHGARFDLQGALLRGPAEVDLKTYPVRREGELLFIAISL